MTDAMISQVAREARYSEAMLATKGVNVPRLAILARVLHDQLMAMLSAGFYGTATIELGIADGMIQHVKHSVQRMEK